MKNNNSKWLAFTISFFFLGCASKEVHIDATTLREKSLIYYNNEIVDNLIRASKGMPILHVNIINLNADIKTQIAATLSGGDTLTNSLSTQYTNNAQTTHSLSAAPTGTTLGSMLQGTVGAVATAGRMAASPFVATVSPQWADDLTISAAPVVNDPEVYKPYIRFIHLKQGEIGLEMNKLTNLNIVTNCQSVKEADDDTVKKIKSLTPVQLATLYAPSTEDAPIWVPGTVKKWDDKSYYYVPWEFRQAYFELSLLLIGRFGASKPLPVSTPFPANGGVYSLPSPPPPAHGTAILIQ